MLLSMLAFSFLYSNPFMVAKAAWYHDYSAELSSEYVDNFRLTETDQIDTRADTLALNLELGSASETSTVTGFFFIDATKYSDSSIEDSDSYALDFDFGRNVERSYQLLYVSQRSQSTTETELLDTGRIVDGTRISTSITPEVGYYIDERNSISTSLNFLDTSYDNVSLVEYTEITLSGSWNYQTDEISILSPGISVSEYNPKNGSATVTNTIGVNYESKFSPAMDYSLGVGFSNIDSLSDFESGGIYSLEVSYKPDQRNDFTGSLSSDFVPSGSGSVVETGSLDFLWNHGISEKLTFDMSGIASTTSSRNYSSLTAGVRYTFRPQWWMGSNIEYRKQSGNTGDAESVGIYFYFYYSIQAEFQLARDTL
ncbi:hypothetical protein N8198_07755 [Gammaproteobacteria bacterium]|nr:hypothetical protein [Gammaproteobacteria bacterium]